MTKFNSPLDEYVYQVSLNGGCDIETGSVAENGDWYGLMRHGHTIFLDHDPGCESLSTEDADTLLACAGVIIHEDAYGFVDVTYHDTMEALDAHRDEIAENMPEYDD